MLLPNDVLMEAQDHVAGGIGRVVGRAGRVLVANTSRANKNTQMISVLHLINHARTHTHTYIETKAETERASIRGRLGWIRGR